MACPGIPALVQSLLQCGCDKMVSSHALPLAGGCLERGLPGGLSAPCLPVADAAHRLTGGGGTEPGPRAPSYSEALEQTSVSV